jgi:hypothetical protein
VLAYVVALLIIGPTAVIVVRMAASAVASRRTGAPIWRPWVRRREVAVAMPVAAVQARVVDALTAIRASVTAEPGADAIYATRGPRFSSFGDRITVWTFTTPTGTSVLIESRPLWPTLYDWGKNQRIVDELAVLIAGAPA